MVKFLASRMTELTSGSTFSMERMTLPARICFSKSTSASQLMWVVLTRSALA